MKKWSIILFIFIGLGLLSCARPPERHLAIKPCVECHQKELKAFLANKRGVRHATDPMGLLVVFI